MPNEFEPIEVQRRKKGSNRVLETYTYKVKTWPSAMAKAKKDYIANHPISQAVGKEEISGFTFRKKKEVT